MNVVDVEFLRRLQAALGDPLIDDEPLRRRLEATSRCSRRSRAHGRRIAAERHPELPRLLPAGQPEERLLDLSALRLTPAPVAVS